MINNIELDHLATGTELERGMNLIIITDDKHFKVLKNRFKNYPRVGQMYPIETLPEILKTWPEEESSSNKFFQSSLEIDQELIDTIDKHKAALGSSLDETLEEVEKLDIIDIRRVESIERRLSNLESTLACMNSTKSRFS